ncbi:MAG: hypothetical protein N2450_02705 [bacterium]|nr:hypothetical protein [bacterium]
MIRKILLLFLFTFILNTTWLVFGANESVTALKFSHTLHLQTVEMTCIQCHGSAKEVKAGVRKNPNHEQCKECHNTNNTNECNTCHVSGIKGGGFGKPFNHTSPEWNSRIHGLDASANLVECRVCHEQASCDQCHSNSTSNLSPHSPNYIFQHSTDAAMGGRCLSCHETRQFCTDCHRKSIPIRHPLGYQWANTGAGGKHAEEGKLYFESCLACHDQSPQEPTCVRCHN